MMCFYHFFNGLNGGVKPEYWTLFRYKGVAFEEIVAPLGQMCVSIFAFNSGYVLHKIPEQYVSWFRTFPRLAKFLLSYWVVCLTFLLYGAAVGLKLPDIQVLFSNLFGCGVSPHHDYINVSTAWYVRYYIFFLLAAPILVKLLNGKKWYLDLGVYALLVTVIPYTLPIQVLDTVWPIVPSLGGGFAHKYRLFEKAQNVVGNFTVYGNIAVSLFLILLVFTLRHELSGYNAWCRLDGFYASIFIFAVVEILSCCHQLFSKVLRFLGRISMYLWFLHSIYFVGGIQMEKILYMPYYPVLITIWGVALMIPPALICKRLSTGLTNLIFHKSK